MAGQLDGDVRIVATGQVAGNPQEAVTLVAQIEVAGDLYGLHVDGRAGFVDAIRTIGTIRTIEPLLVAALWPFATTLVAATPATSAVATLGVTIAIAIALVAIGTVRRRGRAGRRGRWRLCEISDLDLARLDQGDLPIGQGLAVGAKNDLGFD